MLLLGTLSVLCLVVDVAVAQVKPETCRHGYDRCFQSSFGNTVALYDIPATWSLADVLPSWNATILPPLCSDYDQFTSCMPKELCSMSDQLVLEGMDDAWAFLCNDTSPGATYYNYSTCFQQSSAIQGTTYCNNTLYAKLGRLGNLDDQKTLDKACQYYDQYVSCLWMAINSVCGSSAADWHQTYAVNLYTPYVSQALLCPDWGSNGDASNGDDSSIGGILVTTFVALSLLLMLFIVVVLAVVVARRRAKNQLSSRSSAASHGIQDASDTAPPNYTEPYVVFEQTTPEAAVVSATSENSHQEAGDASNGCPQYRIRLVDPLTGRRTDGGVVNSNEFPMKTWPTVLMVPPPYNDQPPPSFSSQPGSDDISGCVPETGVNSLPAESTGAAAADNYGFCPDDAEDKQKLPED